MKKQVSRRVVNACPINALRMSYYWFQHMHCLSGNTESRITSCSMNPKERKEKATRSLEDNWSLNSFPLPTIPFLLLSFVLPEHQPCFLCVARWHCGCLVPVIVLWRLYGYMQCLPNSTTRAAPSPHLSAWKAPLPPWVRTGHSNHCRTWTPPHYSSRPLPVLHSTACILPLEQKRELC